MEYGENGMYKITRHVAPISKELATSIDKVILGGGIANTCLAAQGYNIGKSLVEETMLNEAKEISKNPNIVIPQSVVVSKSPDEPSSQI